MGVTANALHKKLDELSALVTEIHALLANLEITDSTRPGEEHRPRTGWRWRHTEGAGTYIRDPNGTDRLPPGYSLTMHPHPGQPYRDPYGEMEDA